ncbi:redoxin domain-containing protein [Candidatus Daviesbacteria bacterium]|nr:redoxin domain-containing protein [Candidatus Daviesbacteria bacterium]
MKYASIIIVGLVILGTAGFYFYSQNQSASDSMEKPEAIAEKSAGSDPAMKKPEEAMMEGSGEYIPYSDSAFNLASGKKRVLFFFANWCPICKPVDAQLSANTAKIPEGVAIFRVNYNDSDTDATDKALAQKYGITYQHTFVQVDDQGNEITKWNGGDLDKIVSSLK